MTTLLLVIIYIAFISLGLPDSLLGSAWPAMYGELGASVGSAGIISMLIAGGTIVSSLFSDRLIRRLGAGLVTVLSVALTAVALLGFSWSHRFWQLCLWAIPYGLGAGSVDAGLNNFVALHYKSRQMSWLHCFWGIGASAGPYLMGLCLAGGKPWNAGYQLIGVMQLVLVALLVCSLPLWRNGRSGAAAEVVPAKLTLKQAARLPGALPTMGSFLFYCGLESTAGLWAGSYMALVRGVNAETAASWASLFYVGITLGRLLAGFITDRLGDRRMVRLGLMTGAVGILALLLPLGQPALLAGLILLGMGCAPIYPSMLHETPATFGAENSQALMGMQMACAYVGSTFVPPLFGWIGQRLGLGLFPLMLAVLLAGCFVLRERKKA